MHTKYEKDLALRGIKLLNIILMTIPFAMVWYGYYANRLSLSYFRRGHWLILTLFAVFYTVFGRIYNAFFISLSRISQVVFSQTLSAFFANAVMYVLIWLLALHLRNPIPLLVSLALEIIVSAVWTWCAQTWYFYVHDPMKTVVIYDMREGLEEVINQYDMKNKFTIVDTLPVTDCLLDLSKLDGLDVVFLSGVHSHDRNIILKYCIASGIRVYVIPRVGDVLMSSARSCQMMHLPILQVDRYSPNPEYVIIKRLMDILFSSVMLILTSPVFLVTAIAIKLEDGGDVFYKQVRLTKDRREFKIYKFRSMRMDAEKDGVARLSTGDSDDRITKVGKIIRKYRIDELPQLVNILNGTLSICGPRPERPEIAAQYEEEMPEFALRLQAKAGLTGYAQIYGKYNTTPYDKLQMDLMYIAHPSILEDLRLMFATVKILFQAESTEGIAENQETAMEKPNCSNNLERTR